MVDEPKAAERPTGGSGSAATGAHGSAGADQSAAATVPHKPGALERLQARGFYAQCTDEDRLRERLDSGPVTFYVGVDPTGESLHVGHLIPIYALAHLAEFGHRGIVIVGGGTARIGDPSGKSEMRRMLTVEQITANARSIGTQIQRFLDTRNVSFTMVDNAEWLADLNYIEFLRDIGRHFSVNKMLTFEAYKQRLEQGLSFIEFNYQLLQSYDFLKLYQTRGCTLQIGGDDQWGNIVAGADLIRRIEGHEAESFGLTFPLVTRADGKKMGKSEAGAVFLDPERVTPYDFFQYWRNVPDADVRKFLRLYTFLTTGEIDEVMVSAEASAGSAAEAAAINAAKERLATEITTLVHSREEAIKARDAARALFSAGGAGSGGADAMPTAELPADDLAAGIPVLDLFQRAGLSASKSEARRLVQQGGARINDTKVTDIDAVIDGSWATAGDAGGAEAAEPTPPDHLILRAGKKRYFRFLVK
ncbi:MAG: tyrosine--tRNA ligase [Alkalispirochaeta sp.]